MFGPRTSVYATYMLTISQMEPLSVGVHAVAIVGQCKANQNVAVFGAGPVGLLCMAVAKALGARRIIAVDIVQSRLDFAKNYVATDVYLPSKPNAGESKMAYSKRSASEMQAALLFEERGSTGIDIVCDASGAEVCIQTVNDQSHHFFLMLLRACSLPSTAAHLFRCAHRWHAI